ncbi:hypothetical protein L9F63_007538, partial [Diploptera punctata]
MNSPNPGNTVNFETLYDFTILAQYLILFFFFLNTIALSTFSTSSIHHNLGLPLFLLL